MSLRNHCDICTKELPESFRVVGLGQDFTPTRMAVRIHDEPGHLEYAEVCSVKCAVDWVYQHWPAPAGVPS